MTALLKVWVVYFDPLDYPGKYVVRGQSLVGSSIHIDADPLVITDSLDTARAALDQYSLTRMPRTRGDDPAIVETWI